MSTATPDKDGYIPRDFVFLGKRANSKLQQFAEIQHVNDDGTLGEKGLYKWSAKMNKNVGGVYHGASFNEKGSARNLEGSEFQKLWPNQEDRMIWQSETEAVDVALRNAKLEKDEGRISEIEKVMLPIRKTYENMRFRHDYAGCEALEKAVMRALRSAPRVIE